MERTSLNVFAHEPVIRIGVFIGMLALTALWELLVPRRR